MSDIIEYKGYQTKIEFDSDSNLLFGVVMGINDRIIVEAESVTEFIDAFHESVDDYLELCQELNKEPQKPYKGVFNVRVSPALHKKAAQEAYKRSITLNEFVCEAIEQHLELEEKYSEWKESQRIVEEPRLSFSEIRTAKVGNLLQYQPRTAESLN